MVRIPSCLVRLCVLEHFVEIIPNMIEQVWVLQFEPLRFGLLDECTHREADSPFNFARGRRTLPGSAASTACRCAWIWPSWRDREWSSETLRLSEAPSLQVTRRSPGAHPSRIVPCVPVRSRGATTVTIASSPSPHEAASGCLSRMRSISLTSFTLSSVSLWMSWPSRRWPDSRCRWYSTVSTALDNKWV